MSSPSTAATGATGTTRAPAAPPEGQAAPGAARVAAVVGAVVDRIRQALVEQGVTTEEYAAAKRFLIAVGEAREWPLFADVFFESTVEELYSAETGVTGSIAGPYFVLGAPRLEPPYRLPMRDDEAGDPLRLSGTVTGLDGTPVPHAEVELWQCDATGTYSNIPYPDGRVLPPPFTLRGRLAADAEGRFEVRTIVPVPYEIPKEGPTGALLRAAGWHAFRPAHVHVRIAAPDYRPLTSQPYLSTSPYLDSDVANAVKPDLVMPLVPDGDGFAATYEFRLAPA